MTEIYLKEHSIKTEKIFFYIDFRFKKCINLRLLENFFYIQIEFNLSCNKL